MPMPAQRPPAMRPGRAGRQGTALRRGIGPARQGGAWFPSDVFPRLLEYIRRTKVRTGCSVHAVHLAQRPGSKARVDDLSRRSESGACSWMRRYFKLVRPDMLVRSAARSEEHTSEL